MYFKLHLRYVQLSTIFKIIEALGINPIDFFQMFISLSQKEIKNGIYQIQKKKEKYKTYNYTTTSAINAPLVYN